jgi:hypothetical protein
LVCFEADLFEEVKAKTMTDKMNGWSGTNNRERENLMSEAKGIRKLVGTVLVGGAFLATPLIEQQRGTKEPLVERPLIEQREDNDSPEHGHQGASLEHASDGIRAAKLPPPRHRLTLETMAIPIVMNDIGLSIQRRASAVVSG